MVFSRSCSTLLRGEAPARHPRWTRVLFSALLAPALVLSLVANLPQAVVAQSDLALRSLPGGRGEVLLGEGGLVGNPPTGIVGSLGASAAWVDLDGDGFDDYVFGAPDQPANPLTGIVNDAGHLYVLFGDSSLGDLGSDPDRDLVTLALGEGLDLRGRVGDFAGTCLASAGDVDGDGFEDLLIGAPGFDQPGRPGSGSAYVLWGAADWPAQAVDLSLNDLILTGRATRFIGARGLSKAGTSVGGGVDLDADGRDDLLIGAPLDSTGSLQQNGTVSVVYGDASYKGAGMVDLASLVAGQITVVEGEMNFQLLGTAVAGLGRFDPVLPGTGGAEDLVDGDDVALGAPGTLLRGGLFTGAVYVLRGQTSGPLAASLDTSAFSGGDSAGHVYLGGDTGDQAGSFVWSAGDLYGGDGFVELVIGAPFDDGPGRPDTGVYTLVPGRLSGTNPAGFNLGDVGAGDGLMAVQILGAASQDGTAGLSAAGVGDFDGDGSPDLALGFPASSQSIGGVVTFNAGYASYLSGAQLDPNSVHTVDMDGNLTGIELLRVHAESTNARGGSSLAAGDANGDGYLDLLVGAAGAASDPSPQDPTGMAFTNTGRGHVVFGPLTVIIGSSPSASFFEGPSVFITLFGSAVGVSVDFDGVPAATLGVTGDDPIVIEVAVPAPMSPGAAETVDIHLNTGGGVATLANAFTYQAFSIGSGPTPNLVIPGVEMNFTGTAVSSPGDMQVTVGGQPATVSMSDPVAGTLSIVAPVGVPNLVPLDIEFTTSNGQASLVGAVTYDVFGIGSITPSSGRQDVGINVPMGTPGFSYFGEPDLPVQVTLITSSGLAPLDTTIEFGSDTMGYQTAEVTDISGDTVTVNLPYWLLGDVSVPVDVRVTNSEGQLSVTDGFTYLPSDFLSDSSTENPGFGDAPELVAAGDYRPNGKALILLRGWPAAETEFGVAVMGLDLFDPFAPFFGGLLAPMPKLVLMLPLGGLPDFAIQLNHSPTLGPEGLKVWAQFVVQESNGPTTTWSHSNLLEFTVGPE